MAAAAALHPAAARIPIMRRLIVAAMCITALYCSSAVAADTVAERWAAAWNSHDAAKVVYEDVPFGSTNRGKTALRQYAETYFAAVPDMTTTITGSAIANGRGYVEWVFSGTDVGLYKTNKNFSVR